MSETCDHHLHGDANPSRTSRPGWQQARCCRCGDPFWVQTVASASCGVVLAKHVFTHVVYGGVVQYESRASVDEKPASSGTLGRTT